MKAVGQDRTRRSHRLALTVLFAFIVINHSSFVTSCSPYTSYAAPEQDPRADEDPPSEEPRSDEPEPTSDPIAAEPADPAPAGTEPADPSAAEPELVDLNAVEPDAAHRAAHASASPGGPSAGGLPLDESSLPTLPALAREFRGVWVATVDNIDWPSEPGLSADEQRTELLRILDTAKQAGLNAVIFQVRTAADAFYESDLEPWSEYLTGEQGRAPGYDPLAFVVDEAHRRALELHAWFNPYRARHTSARSPAHESHISRRRPDLVRRYGRQLWMDPGEPEVVEHTTRVIKDVVRRYDIDGVHIDDYFYPYQAHDARGRVIDFPDTPSWERYVARGGTRSRGDWRRANVDRLVARLYSEVKSERSWVKFGISPFGIWRPGHPPSVRGLDAYHELYADARKWLNNGWLDYVAPQLYWHADARRQPYRELLQWWVEQNAADRHVWPGNIPNRIGTGANGFANREIPNQIRLTRAQPGASGNVLFSMRSLLANRGGMVDSLRATIFESPALVPASPWLEAPAPAEPRVVVEHDGTEGVTHLTFVHEHDSEPAFAWVVRTLTGDDWTTMTVDGRAERVRLEWRDAEPYPAIAVSAVARNGVEGSVYYVR